MMGKDSKGTKVLGKTREWMIQLWIWKTYTKQNSHKKGFAYKHLYLPST